MFENLSHDYSQGDRLILNSGSGIMSVILNCGSGIMWELAHECQQQLSRFVVVTSIWPPFASFMHNGSTIQS